MTRLQVGDEIAPQTRTKSEYFGSSWNLFVIFVVHADIGWET